MGAVLLQINQSVTVRFTNFCKKKTTTTKTPNRLVRHERPGRETTR